MENTFTFNQQNYTIARYPKTQQRSLRAWQAYQSFILEQNEVQNADSVHIFNDRFGFWNCTLQNKEITSVWNYASQKKAVEQNLISNDVEVSNQTFVQVLEPLPKPIELALLCVPKSFDLFELFLQQIHLHSTKNTIVFCGFMTKHFSPKLLKLAEKYFTVIEQSLAKQKSRFLTLAEPKALAFEFKNKHNIEWKSGETLFQQYYGVFSAHKIDQGSQFLIDNLKLNFDEQKVLDLASGSGVFSLELLHQNSNIELTLIDDAVLAIESAKLNIQNKNTHFLYQDDFSEIKHETFDLIVCNPPFHFEHENNIEVSLNLFRQAAKSLKPTGRMLIVANQHLNYKTQLKASFKTIKILAENKRFSLIEVRK